MSKIERWLADLGLEKYLDRFVAAEIDFETLTDLFEDDLKELDLPLGPRRKIGAALTRLRQEDNVSDDSASQEMEAQAERRHLTVMFVDLVGSTQIAMRLDAEDMREVLSKYQNVVSAVVSSFNGFVATLMGDGVLCYFGWPHANEDDTERAVRAGLAAIEATKKITTPDGTPLAARVGVAAGVVVIGDLIGMNSRREAVVVGETPNLAARLQAVAKPNQLVIPHDTRALLSNAFDVVPLGERELKGVGYPVQTFLVRGETEVQSRFDARQSGALVPLVGRADELAEIAELWTKAEAGQGGMALLHGEAGIGKSRVVRAAIDAVAGESHVRLIYQCSPYHTDSAFHPFIQQMRNAAGLTAKDSNDLRLNKLEAFVQGTPVMQAQMATLLGLDTVPRYGPQDASPAQQRVQLMRAIVDFLISRSREKPLLVVIEDLHWIDPTSLELLEQLLDRLSSQRILVLATARSSFEHNFPVATRLSRISLDRLDRDMTYAIVDRLAGGKTLPEPLLKIIARQTDGVPLFVEELTRTILESDALREADNGFELAGPLSDIAIPTTLHDSLMARLDRLGPIKEIAQIAACAGREFDHRLLLQICDLPDDTLEEALETLVETGLINRRGTPPQARYQFKHALVRDAAYDSLLKERRRPVHRRILSVFENEPGTAPELLALHAEAAGLTDRAIALWEHAGKTATARPAYQEAETHLRRAISLNAPKIGADEEGARSRAMVLHVQLSMALTPVKGLWSDEVITALEQALELAETIGETPLRGDIIYGLLLGTYFRGNLEISVARADELKVLAEASGDIAQLLVANRISAIGRMNMGLFAEAEGYLEQAATLCKQVEDQDLAERYGHDPIVALQIYQSLNAAFRGQTARAESYLNAAMSRANALGHINTICTTHGLAAIAAQVAGNVENETRLMTTYLALSQEHDVGASRMWGEAGSGLLQLHQGHAAGLQTYLRGEDKILEAKIRLLVPGHRSLAALRLHELGLVEEAHQMADSAEALMQETGEKSWLPELFRIRARFATAKSDTAEAKEYLVRAIDIARPNGGVLWHLRAAIDLATLEARAGNTIHAREVLDEALLGVAEGDCPAEVAQAEEILKSLEKARA